MREIGKEIEGVRERHGKRYILCIWRKKERKEGRIEGRERKIGWKNE